MIISADNFRSTADTAPSTWLIFVAPTTGDATFVSSQARDTSVMETLRASAISQTFAITFASLSADASYLNFAYASCSRRFHVSPGLFDKRPAASAL